MGGNKACAATRSLSFDRVFATANEPQWLHFQVQFVSADGNHRLEVWRDHDRRVKRMTDAKIISLAGHRPGDAGYQLTIIDLKRRIATKIDRTNLYRVGNFTDWFDLTHGLRHPKGSYFLSAGTSPNGMPPTASACQWYRLTEHRQTTSICWDARNALPMLIVADNKRAVWKVTQIDTKPVAGSTFAMNLRGFTVNDANRDIAGD